MFHIFFVVIFSFNLASSSTKSDNNGFRNEILGKWNEEETSIIFLMDGTIEYIKDGEITEKGEYAWKNDNEILMIVRANNELGMTLDIGMKLIIHELNNTTLRGLMKVNMMGKEKSNSLNMTKLDTSHSSNSINFKNRSFTEKKHNNDENSHILIDTSFKSKYTI